MAVNASPSISLSLAITLLADAPACAAGSIVNSSLAATGASFSGSTTMLADGDHLLAIAHGLVGERIGAVEVGFGRDS